MNVTEQAIEESTSKLETSQGYQVPHLAYAVIKGADLDANVVLAWARQFPDRSGLAAAISSYNLNRNPRVFDLVVDNYKRQMKNN